MNHPPAIGQCNCELQYPDRFRQLVQDWWNRRNNLGEKSSRVCRRLEGFYSNSREVNPRLGNKLTLTSVLVTCFRNREEDPRTSAKAYGSWSSEDPHGRD